MFYPAAAAVSRRRAKPISDWTALSRAVNTKPLQALQSSPIVNGLGQCHSQSVV